MAQYAHRCRRQKSGEYHFILYIRARFFLAKTGFGRLRTLVGSSKKNRTGQYYTDNTSKCKQQAK